VDETDADWLHTLTPEQQMLLLKPLLEERFKLRVHRETKSTPVYELVIAKNGTKVKQAVPGGSYPNGFKTPEGVSRPGTDSVVLGQKGEIVFQALPIAKLAELLSKQLEIHVVDESGLAGNHDFTMQWDNHPDAGPSIFAAIEEQLGLQLRSAKLPVECLVIDHVERPSPN
jgi:uncharacterized protein (TIGR03435 family)